MGGGTWEYEGDYLQWFRDKKIGDIIDGGEFDNQRIV